VGGCGGEFALRGEVFQLKSKEKMNISKKIIATVVLAHLSFLQLEASNVSLNVGALQVVNNLPEWTVDMQSVSGINLSEFDYLSYNGVSVWENGLGCVVSFSKDGIVRRVLSFGPNGEYHGAIHLPNSFYAGLLSQAGQSAHFTVLYSWVWFIPIKNDGSEVHFSLNFGFGSFGGGSSSELRFYFEHSFPSGQTKWLLNGSSFRNISNRWSLQGLNSYVISGAYDLFIVHSDHRLEKFRFPQEVYGQNSGGDTASPPEFEWHENAPVWFRTLGANGEWVWSQTYPWVMKSGYSGIGWYYINATDAGTQVYDVQAGTWIDEGS
jgi:hypothetical protein